MAFGLFKTLAIEAAAGALTRKRFTLNTTVIGLWVGAFIVFMTAFGFATFAFYLYLAQTMEPLIATVIVSAVLFGVMIVMGLVAVLISNRDHREQLEQNDELKRVITMLAQQGIDDLKEPVQDNPTLAVAVSALAGFMASRYL